MIRPWLLFLGKKEKYGGNPGETRIVSEGILPPSSRQAVEITDDDIAEKYPDDHELYFWMPRKNKYYPIRSNSLINVILEETLVEGGTARATIYDINGDYPLDGFVYAPSLGLQAISKGTHCCVMLPKNAWLSSETPLFQLIYAHASSEKPTLMMPRINTDQRQIYTMITVENTSLFVKLPHQTAFVERTSPFTFPTAEPGFVEAYNASSTGFDTYNQSPTAIGPVYMTADEAIPSVQVTLSNNPDDDRFYLCTIQKQPKVNDFELHSRAAYSNGQVVVHWSLDTQPFSINKTAVASGARLEIRYRRAGTPLYESPTYVIPWPEVS